MEAPVPADERERLETLRSLEILDTDFEEAFDRATRLAAHIMGTPISVVSFVDEDRQWFKSVVGLEVRETPRSVAFCAHSILDDEVMVVEDATADSRFSENPLVLGDPNIRFYAGAPLVVDDGSRLGTLCVIDRQPRPFNDRQRAMLRDLAGVVVDELRLRKGLIVQRQTNERLVAQARELELANESLEQYAYMAAHDLRAPLKRLVSLADLSEQEPEMADSYLLGIRCSAMEMERLVVGYRRLAMLHRGPSELVRVADLVAEAATKADPDIVVERHGDSALSCDPMLISQVFVNLFMNAKQYGSGGPVRCEIRSPDRTSDGGGSDGVRIRVSNAVENDLPVDRTLFAPFRRLEPGSPGRGLGLAIVDRIVKIHRGTSEASCVDGVFAIDISLPVDSAA